MSSDYWDELWRRQPTSRGPVGLERWLDDIKRRSSEWENEYKKSERTVIWSMLLIVALSLPLDPEDNVFWSPLLVGCLMISLVAMKLGLQIRRRRAERDFSCSVIDQMSRTRAVVRDQMIVNELNPIFALPLGIAVGLMISEMAGADWRLAVGVGVVAVGLLGWFFEQQRRKYRALFAERLALLDRAEHELRGDMAEWKSTR